MSDAPSTNSAPLIRVENIHKSYLMGKEAVPALRGVSLDIGRGDMVCLMGPSGSGKTTLLNIVGGLDEPGRGHVAIDDADVVAMSEEDLARLRLERIGFVFQTFNLLNNFTAFENVEAPMVILGRLKKKARRPGRGSSWAWWACPTGWTTTPASSPAASSSGWPSPAPWPTTPRSSSATR